ncbi:MAG: group II truncated hemoglobin [Paracoccaceae bacterium]|nr:group II truncated hemoglobin [Paracoccaceae bacterium]
MQSMLDQIGGEPALRALVDHFYDLIEADPRGENLMRLHFRGHGLAHVRVQQFDFLCGFLGGRRYYEEKHGQMEVRLMHAHVPIARADAESWLALMDQALADMGHSGEHIDRLRTVFRRVALILVNDLRDWGLPAPD